MPTWVSYEDAFHVPISFNVLESIFMAHRLVLASTCFDFFKKALFTKVYKTKWRHSCLMEPKSDESGKWMREFSYQWLKEIQFRWPRIIKCFTQMVEHITGTIFRRNYELFLVDKAERVDSWCGQHFLIVHQSILLFRKVLYAPKFTKKGFNYNYFHLKRLLEGKK